MAADPPSDPPTVVIARVLDRGFSADPGWEHASLLSLVGDLTPAQALFRARPGGRCIWEILLHLQDWRAYVARRLGGEAGEHAEPWPPLPAIISEPDTPSDALRSEWGALLDRMRRTHEVLTARLAALDPAEPYPHKDLGSEPHWLAGLFVQLHDSYHLGQISILRGLQGLPAVD